MDRVCAEEHTAEACSCLAETIIPAFLNRQDGHYLRGRSHRAPSLTHEYSSIKEAKRYSFPRPPRGVISACESLVRIVADKVDPRLVRCRSITRGILPSPFFSLLCPRSSSFPRCSFLFILEFEFLPVSISDHNRSLATCW